MEAKHWGDVPVYSGLYYNNDRPIAAALSHLIKKEHQATMLTISTVSPSVADGALVHLTSMLAEMRASSVDVFWYAAYPNSTFCDFGRALRRFLLELWKRSDMEILGAREFVALSFEVGGSPSPDEYFEKNLQALSTRLWESEILIILDLQELEAEEGRQSLCRLAQRFLNAASRKWRGGIAIIKGDAEDAALHFRSPEAEIAGIIQASRSGQEAGTDPSPNSDLLSEATSLIHPLIVLNQPVQREVLDYVVHHAPRAEADILALLERDMLWRLGNGRIRLSPSGIARYKTWDGTAPSPFLDTIPNGAKVLSFQGAGQLGRQFSSLAEIEKVARDSTVVVDCFATAVAQKFHGDDASSSLQLLSEAISSKTLLVAGDTNTRSLLLYASQMLLTAYERFGREFFGLLERLTYGYADFIQSAYGSADPKNYEASRWVTNLGYVYDELGKIPGHHLLADRNAIYACSATYLSNLAPSDPKDWAEIRYSEAWQLHDSGRLAASVEILEAAARKLVDHHRALIPANQLLAFMAQELYVIALALKPDRELSLSMAACLNDMLQGYGSRLEIEGVRQAFLAGEVVIEAPAGTTPDVVVIASYFDLHTSMLIAQALRRTYRRVPKIVLVPGQETASLGTAGLEPYIDGELALVIGAPDTPGPIGDFVSQRDSELVRLYQLRLLDNFGAAIEAPGADGRIYFLSACGLAGNFYAWHAFVERHGAAITLERSPMEFVLIKELLLIPLATALETRVFNAVTDCLLAKLRGRQRDDASGALQRLRQSKPEQREQMIAGLDGDTQKMLAEITSNLALAEALNGAMDTLRVASLDLNELLSIAEFAYQLAIALQSRTPDASSDFRNVNRFTIGFRQQRQAISDLREAYLASARLDTEKLNIFAEELATTIRNFQNLAKGVAEKFSPSGG